MPSFDRTGPLGRGPLTGRGLGKCVVPEGESNKNWTRFGRPNGMGLGRGIGRGGGGGRRRRW